MHQTASRRKVYLVSFIAALAGLLFGFDTGIISGALLFIQKSFTVTTGMKELIVSSVLFGAMISSLFGGRLTDVYGRKRIILFVAALFIIGTIMASLAPNTEFIMLGRLVIGFAIGIGSYTAPLYIAEAAPTELRGGLVSLNQLMITVGIMSSYMINYVFTDIHGSWRWMFAIGVIPAILLGIGMLYLPKSPRWLVKQGAIDEARNILQSLRGKKDVEHEINEIKDSLKVKQASFKEVFAPWIRPVLFFGVVLGFLQQVSGINTIIYYAPTIFQLAGFHSAETSILATIGIGITNVLATVFAIYVVDKLGRRPLLMFGTIGMGISLLFLSYAFHIDMHVGILRWFAFLSVFVFIISFAVSLGAIMWLMFSEIFPLEVRASAMSIAVFSNWLWNFIVSATFLTLLHKFGASNSFLMYGMLCLGAFAVCYIFAPETKGVTLEQIEQNIRKGLSVRDIGIPRKSLNRAGEEEALA